MIICFGRVFLRSKSELKWWKHIIKMAERVYYRTMDGKVSTSLLPLFLQNNQSTRLVSNSKSFAIFLLISNRTYSTRIGRNRYPLDLKELDTPNTYLIWVIPTYVHQLIQKLVFRYTFFKLCFEWKDVSKSFRLSDFYQIITRVVFMFYVIPVINWHSTRFFKCILV